MRKKIVAGNWKMNTLVSEGVALAGEINNLLDSDDADKLVIIAPPFTHLSEIAKVLDPKRVRLAAQNCSSEPNGAFTGEVAVSMLKYLHVNYVIIGHSERRTYFNETDVILHKKVKVVLETGLIPIFCCGEVLVERNDNLHFDVIRQQVTEGLFGLSTEDFVKVVIAYEPVWAIGTGVTASSGQAQEMHHFIRSIISEKYGSEISEMTSILYGGSCKPSNASELFANPDVDGGLIGGASLKADDFLGIIQAL